MADYGLVAGRKANKLIKEKFFGNTREFNFPVDYDSTEDLRQSLLRAGTLAIESLKAILIIDYGFKNSSDPDEMAKAFVSLQDMFRTQRVRGIKLYLITKNSDLYNKLDGSVDGVSGTLYEDVEIFLVEQEYKPKTMQDILKGKQDRMGLYNKEAAVQDRESRYEREKEEFIRDSRSIDDDILRYGKDEPVSDLSKVDYADSPERLKKVANREKEITRKKDNVKLNKDFNIKRVTKYREDPQKEEVKKIDITIRDSRLNHAPQTTEEDLLDVLRNVSGGSTSVPVGKLESDSGVMSFISAPNAGGSGLVANAADMYAMSKRKVLVIDLDIQKRSQTLYFKSYEKAVRNHQGISNSLLKVAQGGNIKGAAVSVTTKIDVLSVSRNEDVEIDYANWIGGELENILSDAREIYDVVLVDIPFVMLDYYIQGLVAVDRNIFVVENKFYAIEDFFVLSVHRMLEENQFVMGELIRKSSVILNKFIHGNRDEEGHELNHKQLKRMLDEVGYPYDSMMVVGEIPFYEKWEDQFHTGVRYLWEDRLAMGVYKRVFGKVVL
ncbi:AAA family ATPase [Bacillus velezensis]|uniref:AAA family ATPase n=1 Tax=Bacillus velezensis TaxID=492670 RepID=UPI001917DB7F|nr:AAA family ATPase [Bacillus velezensis]